MVAAVTAAVLSSPALGASIATDRPCYREGAEADVVGSGFAPGQPVAVSLDGQQIVTQNADAAGRVGGVLTLNAIPNSRARRSLRMAQVTNLAVNATISITETKLYVVTKPSQFRPGRRLRIRAGGFYGGGARLYSHVRGPRKRNLRIGRVKGPCGNVSATRKVLLKRGDPPGFYPVQFDTRRRYTGATAQVRVLKGYSITRLVRRSRPGSLASPPFGVASSWAPLP
jgi:hypothetical protein